MRQQSPGPTVLGGLRPVGSQKVKGLLDVRSYPKLPISNRAAASGNNLDPSA